MPRGQPRHFQHPQRGSRRRARGVGPVSLTRHASIRQTNMSENQQEPAGVTFTSFVLSLAHTAAFHFGDVADPATGNTGQVHLAAARQIIDILVLLEQKTRGNLTAEERQLLEQIVYELQLRYIEAFKAAPQEASRIIIP